jgi:diguanylate cyclase (GGDEF)-like protein
MKHPRGKRVSKPTQLPLIDRRLRLRLQSLALIVLVAVLLLYQLVLENRRAARRIGIDLAEGQALTIGEVEPTGPAARAGLRQGDAIVAVAGRAVHDQDSYRRATYAFRAGAPVPYVVQRGNQRVTLSVKPGRPLAWWPIVQNLLLVLAYLAVALLALRQQDSDLRARLLFLFACSVIAEFVLPYSAVGPLRAFVVMPLYYLLNGLQMGLELHLASVIPEPQDWLRKRPWSVGVFYVVGLALGVVGALTYLGAVGLHVKLPWTLDAFESVFFNLGFPFWAFLETALLARPALRYPQAQGRQQAALVLAGALPWVVLVAIRTGHFIAGNETPRWIEGLESIFLLAYPVAVLIAISKFQLFDLELVVRRSLVYTALTTSLLLVFYAALGAGGVLFSEFMTGGDRIWVVAGATLLLGLLFTPLRRMIENQIYRRFFPERMALRERLTALAGELPALGKLPLMGERLVDDLCEILDVRSATLLIADPQSELLMPLSTTREEGRHDREPPLLLSPADPGLRLLTQSGRSFQARQLATKSAPLAQRLEALQVQVVSPLLSQGKLIGLLLLGPRAAGDRYVAEELELLNLLAQHVAVVFENARLFESATRDGLTGLLRREAVLERLEGELQRALRYDRPLAIGLADLDHFKSVNDRFGHLTGDSMLKWVARVLQGGLRSTDHVGRYGGEEFLLVLPETELSGAVSVAEKVRCLVEQERFVTEDGQAVGVTLSIGLASLDELPDDQLTVKALIAAADRSLYRAKEEGRNQVHPSVAVGA